MILQWCDQEPCLGAMCPSAMARYGMPTIGHTIPVPNEPVDRHTITALFERHFATAVARDPEGNPRRLPADFAFTIHTVTTTIDEPRQYYTALYSGTADLEMALRLAPLAVEDTPQPQDAPPEGRWGWEPVDEAQFRNLQTTPPPSVADQAPRDEPPELQPPGVATQTRNW